MFERLAFETFAFTHPVTNMQGTLSFDRPPPHTSSEKIIIVPFMRRGAVGNSPGFIPVQLQPGPSVAVSWNNCPVDIPKFVAVKSKLAAAAIHYHPLYVPPSAPFSKVGSNRLVITGGGSEQVSGIALMLVRPRGLSGIEDLVRSHPMSKILKRPEHNDSDEVEVTCTQLQLKDPLSFCRIQIPVKTVKCKHVQCFDLSTFVQYCERNGIWYCPVCPSKPGLSIDDVYIDQFFLSVIESAHDTNTVYDAPLLRSSNRLIFSQISHARWLLDNHGPAHIAHSSNPALDHSAACPAPAPAHAPASLCSPARPRVPQWHSRRQLVAV
jgi:hypothetical protein